MKHYSVADIQFLGLHHEGIEDISYMARCIWLDIKSSVLGEKTLLHDREVIYRCPDCAISLSTTIIISRCSIVSPKACCKLHQYQNVSCIEQWWHYTRPLWIQIHAWLQFVCMHLQHWELTLNVSSSSSYNNCSTRQLMKMIKEAQQQMNY